jgi:hypothetical protein
MIFVLAALACTSAFPTAVCAFEGEIRARFIQIPPETFERIAGGDKDKAFDVGLEKWTAETESGVQIIESRMRVKGDKIRVDGMDPRDPDSFMIVDVAEGITWAVMPARQSVMKFTPEGAKKLADAAEELQAQLESRLRQQLETTDLPPERRQAMEELLARAEAGKKARDEERPKPEVKRSGRSSEIHGFKAEEWEISDGPRSGRVWITDEHADLAALYSKLQKQMAEMRPNGDQSNTLDELIGERGFGVRMQMMDTSLPDGVRYSINDVYETKAVDIPDEFMQLPADYKVMTPDDMLRQHGRPPGAPGS